MRVLLFGATGMVGQGVLRECLADQHVSQVLAVGRRSTGVRHERLSELIHSDLFALDSSVAELAGFDACFFCLGVSSAGMNEERYNRLTYELTLALARPLAKMNPDMIFIYISGVGTDGSEQGSSMWARVKGRTENALSQLPFRSVHLFRPAAILPMHGERSSTPALHYLYQLTGWLFRSLRPFTKGYILTTEEVGRAMLNVGRNGWPTPVLEPPDIRNVASLHPSHLISKSETERLRSGM
ncbi:NAD-dependent epimerase/dehydratase family protein [Pseudomonas petrae]|uniref:NAD-dependent epimerase/dehydratase family protein n=1 Tax=Pseudomonas petrae TaxID=2912190 RepID=A0ABS9I292_9PSED|nr:NAD-dependent epimerase/dehydratase family protein [Pseudomonas petrae]MCF7535106.1 NAD-dependent epimerase/dehydratase family protein [Pseudomonas petrae]MCF7539802.1 NAD-dependent epimerase/dehydratase family protein [Pseudomonas petrae]MCF7541306.1 NAD-dependent epimerase/dehydratase family protein [Pseudomonas petrae]MCF7558361.1 NAD-dependent epimerase/dehydratase family protein [Pseudomonas petrae]